MLRNALIIDSSGGIGKGLLDLTILNKDFTQDYIELK